jgi:hypothetical protein
MDCDQNYKMHFDSAVLPKKYQEILIQRETYGNSPGQSRPFHGNSYRGFIPESIGPYPY